jgi:hypothetical protein
MKHFTKAEFLPKCLMHLNVYNVLDNRIVETAEQIRNFFGRLVIINNWERGGKYQYRGYRPQHCGIGATYSQHRFGRAIDFDVKGLSADYVRSEIIASQKRFEHITRMEEDVGWVHVDLMYTGVDEIYLFKG